MDIFDVEKIHSAVVDYLTITRKCEHPEWSNFGEEDLNTQLMIARKNYLDVIEQTTGVRIEPGLRTTFTKVK